MGTGSPDRLYLRIGDVSGMTGLASSVLRYWETEFSSLAPKKSSTGQRLYTKKDIELITEIKKLLYAEKLTIEGARKRLQSRKKVQETGQTSEILTAILQDVKLELIGLRDLL